MCCAMRRSWSNLLPVQPEAAQPLQPLPGSRPRAPPPLIGCRSITMPAGAGGLLLLLAAAAAQVPQSEGPPAGASRGRPPPHILLMLADDLGNYEVGFHNPLATTPHIDSLAAEGVVLERHYVYHMCGPTRSATMT
eukprot:SAG22_NODE_7162_length_769_cov_2.664179_1_plen_135_part_01